MKIALFSDIHGNDIAFAAAETHARQNGADLFVIAGDLITDNPMTREVLERARALTPHIVSGNREQYLISYHEQKQKHWQDCIQFAPLRWVYAQLRNQDIQFIQALPESIEVPLDDLNTLYVVHQIPQHEYDEAADDHYMGAISRYFQRSAVQYSVYCCGHTHRAAVKQVGRQVWINAGSVGQKFYGGFQAAYVMLEWQKGLVSFKLHNVDYDRKAYWAMLEASGLLHDPSTRHWTQLFYQSIKHERNYFIDFFATAGRIRRENKQSTPHISDDVWRDTVRVFIQRGILT